MTNVVGAQPLTKAEIKSGLQRLPALSATVTQLLELTQRDDVDVDQVARTVAYDPVLSARLLRVANSPFFGLAGEITSINQACMTLGMNTVRNLAVAVGVGSCFSGGDEQDRLWQQSMEKAIAAQALARLCRQNSETEFTAGMLHDLGKMVMVSCFTDAMKQTIAYQGLHSCELSVAEQAVFGMVHVQIGEMAAKQWHLPALIVQVISGRTNGAEEEPHPVVDIVMLAAVISSGIAAESAEELLHRMPEKSVVRLGLNLASIQAWLVDVEKNRAMAQLLV